MIELAGKTAVITGAASGIGFELARRFGAAGMKIVAADVEASALATATGQLSSAGFDVLPVVVDVRHLDELVALEATARGAFGNVHLLCNNAGVGGRGPVADPSNLEAWRWTIDVNLWGVINGCKVFLPGMIEHGEPCHVVNTASMAGLTSLPGTGAYNVSKHGVVALSETLAMEMRAAETRVGVSVVCPGFVATRIGESRRNMPDDVRATLPAKPAATFPASTDLIAAGMSADSVAQAVSDGVRHDRFWILTHDEMKASVVQRAENIVDGVNPAPHPARELSMRELVGKTAVVTGAASGIGLELAHRFGQAGMRVVVADVERVALERAASELSSAGHDVMPFVVDVRNYDEVVALEAASRRAFGNVHLVCNNAGVGADGPVADPTNIEAWRWTIDVDLWGVIHGCKAFLPAMLEHGEPCRIVNTSSMAGLSPAPLMGAYAIAKFGVVAVSETLAMEMAGTNVGVSVLCPALVATRIAESERNMPDAVRSRLTPTPEAQRVNDKMRHAVAQGMTVDVIGDAVIDAVLHDRFWIVTHADKKPGVLQRARDIVAGVNPTPKTRFL